jgi:hypothetical protein
MDNSVEHSRLYTLLFGVEGNCSVQDIYAIAFFLDF